MFNYIVFATFSVFILVLFWNQFKLKTIWKTHLIIGKKGSGKSTYAVSLMLKYANRYTLEYDSTNHRIVRHPFKIYTNMHTSVPNVRYVEEVDKLGKFVPEPYSILILDEVNTIRGWDNREFKDTDKDTIKFFRYARQYKVITYLFTQTFDIDRKLRSLVDTMTLCTNFMTVFTCLRKIDKRVTIKDSALDADQQIVDDVKFAPWFIPGNIRLLWIPKFTRWYSSYNPPVKPFFNYVIETKSAEKKRKFRIFNNKEIAQ